MAEEFKDVEEILASPAFQAWYFRDHDSDTAEWESWMKNHPEKHHLVDQAILFLKDWPREHKVSDTETEAAYQKLQPSLFAELKIRRSSGFTLWKWAAAAAAVFLIGFWAIRQYNIQKPEQVWQTGFGQLRTINLSDGTTVTLNANSSLTGQENWKHSQERELWLDGEAFFEVATTDNHQKMIVHTHSGDIVVTGTQFNVRSRGQHTTVLLTEGRVTLRSNNGAELALLPGEFASLSTTGLQKEPTNEKKELAWKEGKMVFEQTPPTEIARMIEEQYGKKVEFKGKTDQSGTLTGIMPNNQLKDLLEAMKLATGWEIHLTENNIIIVVN